MYFSQILRALVKFNINRFVDLNCLTLPQKRRGGLWLEGIQLWPEMDIEINFLPIRLCFINVYTYPNPKPTPYKNEKIIFFVVQCEKNVFVLMCACPVTVASYVSLLDFIAEESAEA